jgi:DNA-binding Lrp family transcriptional regulator
LPAAFLLINADLGSEEELVKQLKSMENVTEVSLVYGVYDIIVKVETQSMKKMKETVTWKIRHLQKVRSILTMIAVGE